MNFFKNSPVRVYSRSIYFSTAINSHLKQYITHSHYFQLFYHPFVDQFLVRLSPMTSTKRPTSGTNKEVKKLKTDFELQLEKMNDQAKGFPIDND